MDIANGIDDFIDVVSPPERTRRRERRDTETQSRGVFLVQRGMFSKRSQNVLLSGVEEGGTTDNFLIYRKIFTLIKS